jgi:hypothetical protein
VSVVSRLGVGLAAFLSEFKPDDLDRVAGLQLLIDRLSFEPRQQPS